jgi:hypothetical protein
VGRARTESVEASPRATSDLTTDCISLLIQQFAFEIEGAYRSPMVVVGRSCVRD